jgi:hypothetical protein
MSNASQPSTPPVGGPLAELVGKWRSEKEYQRKLAEEKRAQGFREAVWAYRAAADTCEKCAKELESALAAQESEQARAIEQAKLEGRKDEQKEYGIHIHHRNSIIHHASRMTCPACTRIGEIDAALVKRAALRSTKPGAAAQETGRDS